MSEERPRRIRRKPQKYEPDTVTKKVKEPKKPTHPRRKKNKMKDSSALKHQRKYLDAGGAGAMTLQFDWWFSHLAKNPDPSFCLVGACDNMTEQSNSGYHHFCEDHRHYAICSNIACRNQNLQAIEPNSVLRSSFKGKTFTLCSDLCVAFFIGKKMKLDEQKANNPDFQERLRARTITKRNKAIHKKRLVRQRQQRYENEVRHQETFTSSIESVSAGPFFEFYQYKCRKAVAPGVQAKGKFFHGDSNPCTENDVCTDGTCSGTDIVFPDTSDVCTDNVCVNGACVETNNANDCDDSNPCTENDVCTDGTCSGTDIVCPDTSDVCTDNVYVNGACVKTNNTNDCDVCLWKDHEFFL